VRRDFRANRGNSKGLVFILLFRMAHFFVAGNWLLKTIGLP
jgi:hypothetical protein